ncbi:DUF4649 family protein [Streptococcus loxodontisalivarius]|uniref:DUF4649 family protein n=1 Tax=Streptococcus loxodontisalivarius TaxID=1349415 RepID=A0ABS2PRN9_9STRE|nr:DUF4649 family protein [Streptococcus loxodontisalivarius]MBM7642708.1 hypothetical protein [Streptococcus loxodontisalivarius]
MLEITYLDAGKREKVVQFETYNEYVRSEQACWHDIHDYFKTLKVTYNGHDLNYQGPYGDLYRFLLKVDLKQYD